MLQYSTASKHIIRIGSTCKINRRDILQCYISLECSLEIFNPRSFQCIYLLQTNTALKSIAEIYTVLNIENAYSKKLFAVFCESCHCLKTRTNKISKVTNLWSFKERIKVCYISRYHAGMVTDSWILIHRICCVEEPLSVCCYANQINTIFECFIRLTYIIEVVRVRRKKRRTSRENLVNMGNLFCIKHRPVNQCRVILI